jgi:glycosyltransferase involved in cell wall biosynthesis
MRQDMPTPLQLLVETLPDRPRLVVFSDDWGRHPSSSQHLILQLLPRYRVDWINTVGTHRPRLSLGDLRRGVEKLKGWTAKRRESAPAARVPNPMEPLVHAPVHWPGFKTRAERMLNQALLRRALGAVLNGATKPVAVITTVPITADLAAIFPGLKWIYYCVDDFAEWPGLDGDTLRRMELDLLRQASTVICVSDVLKRRLAALGIQAHLLTHGVELSHWQAVRRRPLCGPGRRPTLLYWGHADKRLDADILLHLTATCDVRMVGRYDEVDGRLIRQRGITWTGPQPYERLPELASEADVLIMPYADLAVTRAMQPLKLKEYLATGLPVVATPLPANRAWGDAMDLTSDPDHFAKLCLARARRSLPESQARARGRLANESWENKALQFEQWFMASKP